MPLIVEDGSGVAGAQAYADAAATVEYYTQRGMDALLPTDETELEALIICAVDWLELQRDRYKGAKTSSTQPLEWPRRGVLIGSDYFADDELPPMLIQAQHQLVLELVRGIDLLPTVTKTEPQLASRQVGPLRRQWFKADPNLDARPQLNAVEMMLAPLVVNLWPLRSERV